VHISHLFTNKTGAVKMENKPKSKEMDDKFVAEIPRSALTGGIVCPHCMKHITPIYFIMAHKAEPRVDAHELTTE